MAALAPRRGGMLRRAAGFTLIEVMVAVLIIAVLSSLLVIAAVPGDSALVEREARRLAVLLEQASSDARGSGQGIAWLPEGDRYSFLRRDEDGEWTAFPEDSLYRPRALPGGAALETVQVDGRELQRGERVLIPPYGVRPLFAAAIAAGKARVILRGGVLGRVSLQRAPGRAT